MEDENTELRIILEHYFNDTNFTECLLADTCTDQLVEAGSELGPGSWVLAALVAVYSLVLVAGLLGSASKSSIRRFVITEKAPTRAVSTTTLHIQCYYINVVKM